MSAGDYHGWLVCQLPSGSYCVICGGDARRVRAEIFLIDDAVLIDDEGHDAGIAIGGRIGDQRKAARHMAIDDIILSAAGRVLSLLGQNVEIVAVIGPRLWMRRTGPITGRPGARDERPQRAFLFAGFDGPIEPIALADLAHEVLRVFRRAAGPQVLGGIFALGRDVGAAHFDDAELVAADAPIENLILTGLGVEAPAGVLANERDWQGPLVCADDQDCLAVTVALEFMRFIIGGNE